MKLITEKSYNKNQKIEKEIKLFKLKPLKTFLEINLDNFDKKDKSLQEKSYLLSSSMSHVNIDINKLKIHEIDLDVLIKNDTISTIDYFLIKDSPFLISYSLFDDVDDYHASFIYMYRLLIEIYKDIKNEYIYFLREITFITKLSVVEELDPNPYELTSSSSLFDLKKLNLDEFMEEFLNKIKIFWESEDDFCNIHDIEIILKGYYKF